MAAFALLAAMPAAPAAGATAAAAATVPARPSAGCARATIATGRRIDGTIDVGGVTRRYVLDVPEDLRPGAPVPLLLDFHGIGHSAAGLWEVSGFRELAPRERFVTAYPDGLPVTFTRGERTFSGPGWEIRTLDHNRDVDFALALLDRLESTYCIDRARVFVTGFSNGAYLAHVLACTHAERFAAAAPVSGGWIESWSCRPSRPVPVLIHHGREDDVLDVAEGRAAHAAWLAIDGCTAADAPSSTADATGMSCAIATHCKGGAVVEYCEGDFRHQWPASTTVRVWEFLEEHPLPAKP